MKKTISIILALVMLCSFACCGGKNDGASGAESSAFETTTSTTTTTSFETQSQTENSTTIDSPFDSGTGTTTTSQSTAAYVTTIESTTALTTEATATETTTEITTEASTKNPTSSNTCFVTIDCHTINDNIDDLMKGKKAFVPVSGYILKNCQVEFENGATAFDVLQKACKENTCDDNCQYCQKNGIAFEYSYSPAYSSNYIEGVHQLYEMDCGSLSGWMVLQNGKALNESPNSSKVSSGDTITLIYTCNMGDDIGIIF